MSADFRALCAELTTWAEKTSAHYFQPPDVLLRARAALADEPAAPKGREWPSDEELLDLHDWMADEWAANHDAELPLSQYARAVLARWGKVAPVPVAVSERPWEREEWCDTDGLCWLGGNAFDGSTPTWLYGSPAWAERFQNVHRVLLPAHALPLPEVGE